MYELHKLFAYAIVFLVGGIVALIEIPVRSALFWIALILYIVIALTAPLWVKCDTEKVSAFIKSSLLVKPIWMKKAMRAYRDALI